MHANAAADGRRRVRDVARFARHGVRSAVHARVFGWVLQKDAGEPPLGAALLEQA